MKKCYTTVEDIIKLLPVQTLADLCGISKQYCHKLLKEKSKLDVFKMYCEIMVD